jgi:hypothetical protein
VSLANGFRLYKFEESNMRRERIAALLKLLDNEIVAFGASEKRESVESVLV